ncbi:MAG TPA: cell division protein [Selenomonas sp.]|nr:cell division protein [Selenomonas sp.]
MPRIKKKNNIKTDNMPASDKVRDEGVSHSRRGRPSKAEVQARLEKEQKENTKTASGVEREKIFALDIGTRSVIGIVAEKDEEGVLHVLATTRQEHKTRAMLDGQIHDVLQVATVIRQVKKTLADQVGPISTAAVAAAGRALYTATATATAEIEGLITEEQQRSLNFAGVQAAQTKLAENHTIEDPTLYYCVGYSTIGYALDDLPLKTLVGQKGKKAQVTVIATFLPRQVIDSMQTALHECMLEMQALTLEPIAAINVLIPVSMRHLNLVLVDIGAGTSDIAITRNGAVVAYGMVPLAGDEITEAISNKFLLDFNVAEEVKRKAANGQGASFRDILGNSHAMKATEIIEPILPDVQKFAHSIATEILKLNGDQAPQAVMLVGGGSLTPMLQQFVSRELAIPENRVAVRRPDAVEGIVDIPDELRLPDAVTPLGILKVASVNKLHFLSVFVNDTSYSLFHFRDLTVSDALLSAGIQLKKFDGHPGLGLMVTINGKKKIFPGTMGTSAVITMDGKNVTLNTPIHDNSYINVMPGKNGQSPEIPVKNVVTTIPGYEIYINDKKAFIQPRLQVNGKPADMNRLLADGDVIESSVSKTVGEALLSAGYPPTGRKIHYKLNGRESTYSCSPEILLEGEPATISQPIQDGDHVEYIEDGDPKLKDVLNIKDLEISTIIYYNDEEYRIPTGTVQLEMNGHSASPNTLLEDGCDIRFRKDEHRVATVSDALLAVGFQPPAATSRISVRILVNNMDVEFTSPINNKDTLEIIMTPLDPPGDSQGKPIEPTTTGTPFSETEMAQEPKSEPAPEPPKKMSIEDFMRRF